MLTPVPHLIAAGLFLWNTFWYLIPILRGNIVVEDIRKATSGFILGGVLEIGNFLLTRWGITTSTNIVIIVLAIIMTIAFVYYYLFVFNMLVFNAPRLEVREAIRRVLYRNHMLFAENNKGYFHLTTMNASITHRIVWYFSILDFNGVRSDKKAVTHAVSAQLAGHLKDDIPQSEKSGMGKFFVILFAVILIAFAVAFYIIDTQLGILKY